MPYLNLVTNVKIPDPKAFALEFSKFGGEVLGKPENFMSASYTYNDTLTFGGSLDPAFQLTITSLFNINAEVNQQYARKISVFLKEKLGVSDDRGYITFFDPGAENIGYKSTTFKLFLQNHNS
ncbi:hypothetical protein AX14_011996 [Amanita brunnescens Koide BX004]|nr:hypothetical protein AX14_011996 [Amanita brunnescens Koide BX004]